MELKGTKTEKNLMEAFAGESMARNKYTFFASVLLPFSSMVLSFIPVYRVCGEVIPSPAHSMFLWEYCTTRSHNNQESFLFMACQEFSFVFSHYAV